MTISRNRPTLIVMVKEPLPGRVKTRLGRDIGVIPATWWLRHQTHRLIRRMRDPRLNVILAVSPDYQGLTSRFWPNSIERIGQGAGDLGARMAHLLNVPDHGPVCIIGGDIPAISPTHIVRAFAQLGSNDFVFGPATDGGFWLVGAKRIKALPPRLFGGIEWSTPNTLKHTVLSLGSVRVGFADRLSDVDTKCDLTSAH